MRVRTLFLSDIHLGYRHARARELNEFLSGVEAENIVLVGDIVDALVGGAHAGGAHLAGPRSRRRTTRLHPGQPRREPRRVRRDAAGPVRGAPRVVTPHRARRAAAGAPRGPIHRAKLRHIDGTLYGNTGDWVESCSALLESAGGELKLLRWPHAAGAPRRRAAGLVADAA